MQKPFVAASLLSFYGATARQFTVKNNCQYTVWCIFTDLNAGKSTPDQPTGWEAAAGSTTGPFNVPDDRAAGRIWGRRDCDFSKPDTTSCATGSCNGGLLCAASSGTARPRYICMGIQQR
ncbi:hypothetical protein GGX14DRAFT_3213 [Mycena pura]|uniref:Thaumatin-like protein n=1 Tax=Mycena pura TaxID=153505 RepID=A0AAD6YVB3_9AGAR|nr:hypothetical protein GGX14DRAFT_3213 [Mycena pura]